MRDGDAVPDPGGAEFLALDEAVESIGRNVTGVRGDSANMNDLDRLFDAIRHEKSAIDVLWASAGTAEEGKVGEVTEEQLAKALDVAAMTAPKSS